jgi:hypothetical protein
VAVTTLQLKQAIVARDAEIIRLRGILADIESLPDTLEEAKKMASVAIPSRKPD